MTRKLSFIMLTAMMAAGTSSIMGADLTRNVKVGKFTKIDACCGVTVEYTESVSQKVTLTAPVEIIDRVFVHCSAEELEVGVKGDNKGYKIVLKVDAAGVTDFEAESGAMINVGPIVRSGKEVEADASSGGMINFESIRAQRLDMEASSGGAINMKNTSVFRADFEASSGAVISAEGKTTEADFEASSGAVIKTSQFIGERGKCEATTGAVIKSAIRNCKKHTDITGTIKNVVR